MTRTKWLEVSSRTKNTDYDERKGYDEREIIGILGMSLLFIPVETNAGSVWHFGAHYPAQGLGNGLSQWQALESQRQLMREHPL